MRIKRIKVGQREPKNRLGKRKRRSKWEEEKAKRFYEEGVLARKRMDVRLPRSSERPDCKRLSAPPSEDEILISSLKRANTICTLSRYVSLCTKEKEIEPSAILPFKKKKEKTAREQQVDVVLVDTAGRMQDNKPLMESLSELVHVNKPNLVLFVGEALVGNDGVDQLTKFNASLQQHTPVNEEPRLIDGVMLTKFDTVDDKVGAALSMVYSTGIPILFVGVGQQYSDLKKLNVNTVVNFLMN